MRPPKEPSDQRSIARGGGRSRNLERRYTGRDVSGLPVPPWTVDYDTGEVTGAADGELTPLVLTGAGSITANALTLVADSTGNAKALIIEAGDDGAATGIEATVAPGGGAVGVGEFLNVGGPAVTGSDLYGHDVNVEGYDGVLYGGHYVLTGDSGLFGVAVDMAVDSATGVGKGFFCAVNSTGGAEALGADLGASVLSGALDAIALRAAATNGGSGDAWAIKVTAGLTDLDLATSDPGVAGALWNDGGYVAVSGTAPVIDGGSP